MNNLRGAARGKQYPSYGGQSFDSLCRDVCQVLLLLQAAQPLKLPSLEYLAT
jgi:hypothetical protein